MPSLGKSTQGNFGTDDRSRRSIRHDRYSLKRLPGGWLVDFQVGWREKLRPPNESKLPEYFMAKTWWSWCGLSTSSNVWCLGSFCVDNCSLQHWLLHGSFILLPWPMISLYVHDWWMIGDSWWWFMANICRGFCPTVLPSPCFQCCWDSETLETPAFSVSIGQAACIGLLEFSEWPVSIMHYCNFQKEIGTKN